MTRTDLSREAARVGGAVHVPAFRVLAAAPSSPSLVLDPLGLAEGALAAAPSGAHDFADLDTMLRIAASHLVSVAEGVPGQPPELYELGVAAATAGVSIDSLIAVLGDLTVRVMDRATQVGNQAGTELGGKLKQLMETGHRLTRSLLNGFHSRWSGSRPTDTNWTGEQLARTLLSGAPVPDDLGRRLADSYAVTAIRAKSSAALARLRRALATPAWSTTFALLHGIGGYLLGPAADIDGATELAARLRGLTTDPLWCGVAWAPRDAMANAGEQAGEAVAIAMATASPAGTYQISDFLVEYAATRQAGVREELIRLVQPVLANTVLRETLVAFLDADGNRTKAAQNLIVHRSTLDYRLGRIAAVTGHSPTTPRGLQVLGTALTICAVDAERAALPSVANQ
jgi:PucR C-terminal helix-turn-helix domain